MCTSLCFWGCSNDENEFVISSEKITSVEQMVTKPDSIIVPIEGNRDSLQKLKTIKQGVVLMGRTINCCKRS